VSVRTRPRRFHVLEREQFVPTSVETTYRFFADARNLEVITPPWLSFRVVTEGEIRMAVGTTIDYRIRMLGVPMAWRSLISRWEPGVAFVDEQVEGPYRWWHHLHTFEAHEGGTILRDRVEYAVPGGPLAPLVHAVFVAGRLRRIFDFRRDAVARIFVADSATLTFPADLAATHLPPSDRASR
jgi:ligand-binding SRPBCC domain-containing protein